MVITEQFLLDAIEEVQESRSRVEADLNELEIKVQELRAIRDQLVEEESAFRGSLSRRFPSAATASPPWPSQADEGDGYAHLSNVTVGSESGWDELGRSEAVEHALRELDGVGSPGQIEEFLSGKGRSDNREDVSSAIAYLHRKHKVQRVSRGLWRLLDPHATE